MAIGLRELLGKDWGGVTIDDDGSAFAKKVITAARKRGVPLSSIPELAHADLDENGEIGQREIAALISIAHTKRAGYRSLIVSSGDGTIDGRAVENPNYDPKITVVDLEAMRNPVVIKAAKQRLKDSEGIPTLDDLLKGIGKETMDILNTIRGGIEVPEPPSELSPSIRSGTSRNSSDIGRR